MKNDTKSIAQRVKFGEVGGGVAFKHSLRGKY